MAMSGSGAVVLRRLLRQLTHRGEAADAIRHERIRGLFTAAVEHFRARRLAEAEACYREVLTFEAEEPDALNQLGVIALRRCSYDTALEFCDRAVAGDANRAQYHEVRALALASLGRCDESLAAYRRAQALAPEDMRLGANLLHLLDVHPTAPPEQTFREHRDWAARHFDAIAPIQRPERPRDPDRPLAIGYVSGDFCMHAAGFFIMPLLEASDGRAFTVTAYQTSAHVDELSGRMRERAARWRDVTRLSDDALAQQIVEDEIDILVDLAGISRDHRSAVFARRPAPVQITYLGYLGTTGLRTMDYRITDTHADPPEASDAVHTEKLLRLPRTQWCFEPPADAPAPLARGVEGPVVFGAFNRLMKANPRVLETWAEILARVPDSQLVMVDVPSERVRRELLSPFLLRGIAEARVATHGRLPRAQFRELLRRSHIGLDTFPYNGGATICEALWLGVPVVTRAGNHGFARTGASVLANVGLPDLVAQSDADYVDIAVALAAERARLAALQEGLRDRMRGSPLLDAPAFTRDLETAYRKVWHEYCARRPR
jgi:protein O-GlcNAc transferase